MQSEKITPDDADEPGYNGHPSHSLVYFGSATALDGDTLVVSTAFDESASMDGWVYVFERSRAGDWTQVAKLFPQENQRYGFGKSLDVDEDAGVIVVGDPGFDKPGDENADEDDGAAYVFERATSGAWVQTATLYGRDDRPDRLGASFGGSVAVDGDRVVVSARHEDMPSMKEAGAVYVFERGSDGWIESERLTAETPERWDQFGGSRTGLGLEGGRLAVGAPEDGPGGSVHVFEHEADEGWTSTSVIHSPDGKGEDQPGGDCFGGYSVALDDGTLVVGDVCWDSFTGHHTPLPQNAGRAYVYESSDSGWTLQATLKPSDNMDGDSFGKFVDIDGDTIVGGAVDTPPQVRAGAAYVFERTGDGWTETAKLVSNETTGQGDYFGWSATISDGTIVVGSPFDDNRRDGTPQPLDDVGYVPVAMGIDGSNAGSIYTFERGDPTEMSDQMPRMPP